LQKAGFRLDTDPSSFIAKKVKCVDLTPFTSSGIPAKLFDSKARLNNDTVSQQASDLLPGSES